MGRKGQRYEETKQSTGPFQNVKAGKAAFRLYDPCCYAWNAGLSDRRVYTDPGRRSNTDRPRDTDESIVAYAHWSASVLCGVKGDIPFFGAEDKSLYCIYTPGNHKGSCV